MSLQGKLWNGKYGRNKGNAPLCVKYVDCLHCGVRPGQLCFGVNGPHLETHYIRRYQYREYQGKLINPFQRASLDLYRKQPRSV